LPQNLDTANGALDLRSGRHQLRAVRKTPAVILNMGNFDSAGAERDRLLHHGGDAVNISAMDDSVDGEHNAEPHHFSGESPFARIGTVVASDPVRGHGVGVLDRDLDVVEAGFRQRRNFFLSEPNGRGD
jgi:hypothetical protein